MSRAFVKEQDAEALEVLPARPVSRHPNDVTENGMTQLESMLSAEREAYAAAHAPNDRAAMAQASRDRYWTARAQRAASAEPNRYAQVRFGSSVSIRRQDGREQTFRIVVEDEADP
jgi:transcription elongation GreA/GreB family factor